MNADHPYRQYEGTRLWNAIDKALEDLIANGDLEPMTSRQHIVGYLTKAVCERRLSSPRLRSLRTKLRKTQQASEDLASALVELDELEQQQRNSREAG